METYEHSTRKMENTPDGNSDDESDEMVPQIQKELDKLNQASTEINRLENELDEARSKYRSIITETSARMEFVSQDIKRSIQRAREYYKLKEEAKLAQMEALKAARLFQSATGVYNAAKETVALAECSLIEETDTPTAHLSSAWQEMLSHAITKVNESEREKTKSEQEHKRRATRYAELGGRIQLLEKKYSKSIKKAKPYFELKAELDIKLMQQKHNVHDLQTAIKSNKEKYSESFRTLEAISEAIHISRSNKIWSMFPRMPGVGSETFSISSGLSELGLDQSASTDGFTSKGSDIETEDTSDNEFDDTVNGAVMEERTPSKVMEDSSTQDQLSSSEFESFEKRSPDSNRQLDNTKDDVKTDQTEDFTPNYNPQINDVSCKGGTEPAKTNNITFSTSISSHDMNHTDESIAKTAHSLLFENRDETIENRDEKIENRVETTDNHDETSTDDNSDEIFEEAREFHDEEVDGKSKTTECDESLDDIEKSRTGVMFNESDKSYTEASEINEATDGHRQSQSFTNVQRSENLNDNSGEKLLTDDQSTENTPESLNDTVECSMQKGFTDDHSETSSSSVSTDIRNIERPSVSGEED